MGSDREDVLKEYLGDISIHAPAWGATIDMLCKHLGAYISIHAPAWGATLHLH